MSQKALRALTEAYDILILFFLHYLLFVTLICLLCSDSSSSAVMIFYFVCYEVYAAYFCSSFRIWAASLMFLSWYFTSFATKSILLIFVRHSEFGQLPCCFFQLLDLQSFRLFQHPIISWNSFSVSNMPEVTVVWLCRSDHNTLSRLFLLDDTLLGIWAFCTVVNAL